MAKNRAGATDERHETELAEVLAAVRDTLARAGRADGAPASWPFQDLTPRKATAAEPVVVELYQGIPGCVLGAADVVHETARLYGGESAAVREVLGRLANDLALLSTLRDSPSFQSELVHSDGLSAGAFPAGQRRATNGQVILDGLSALNLQEQRDRFQQLDGALAERRSLAEKLYRPRGPGAEGHFIFELWDIGLTPRQIAEIVEHREVRRLQLEPLRLGDHLDAAAENLRKRLDRYREELPCHWRTFPGFENVPPEKFVYRAFSTHVAPYTRLDVAFRSGPGVPSLSWHSTPLDPDGSAP